MEKIWCEIKPVAVRCHDFNVLMLPLLSYYKERDVKGIFGDRREKVKPRRWCHRHHRVDTPLPISSLYAEASRTCHSRHFSVRLS